MVKDVINNTSKSMLPPKSAWGKQLKDPIIGRQRIEKKPRLDLAHVRLKKYGGAKLSSVELPRREQIRDRTVFRKKDRGRDRGYKRSSRCRQ